MADEEKNMVEETVVEETVVEEKAGETDRDAELKAAPDSSESSESTVDVSAVPESVPDWTVVTMKTVTTNPEDGSTDISGDQFIVMNGGYVYDLTDAPYVTWDEFISYYVVVPEYGDSKITSVQVGYAMPGHDLQRLYINREAEGSGK